MIRIINGLPPSNEMIGRALGRTVLTFPELAVRKLVANALIHQDFFITGTGPMVEIFENGIEVTNPGAPLVDPERLLDDPPHSRNESRSASPRSCDELASARNAAAVGQSDI